MEIAKCNPEQLCIITCKNIINTFECTIFTQLSAKNNQLNFRINRKKIFFEAPWEVVRLYMKKKKALTTKIVSPNIPKTITNAHYQYPVFKKSPTAILVLYVTTSPVESVFFSLHKILLSQLFNIGFHKIRKLVQGK